MSLIFNDAYLISAKQYRKSDVHNVVFASEGFGMLLRISNDLYPGRCGKYSSNVAPSSGSPSPIIYPSWFAIMR